MTRKKRIIIMGAAGRDFHNFNVSFKNDENVEVVAFTAAQIPGIDNRDYPMELSGARYPHGIPVYPEERLQELISELSVDEVVFAYSDVSFDVVMEKASMVLAAGADYRLMGTESTMLKSSKPVVSVTAIRTGSGKSQVSRYIGNLFTSQGFKVIVIRHPMPYGNLKEQEVQRYSSLSDLDFYKCTIEEREEYEPHIEAGLIVYAGVDYRKILEAAEKEADLIIWDGGNNDFSFYKPDLEIVVVDPLRVGDETSYYPGTVNLLRADLVLVNKVNSAQKENVEKLLETIKVLNGRAEILMADSKISVDNPELIKGRSVMVIEDGPTLTHGEMTYGAGLLAARMEGAREIVDPRTHAVGEIAATFKKWPKLTEVIPAMGYSEEQIRDLEKTIDSSDAETVVTGTPIDLRRVMKIEKPVARVFYDLEEHEKKLEKIIRERVLKVD